MSENFSGQNLRGRSFRGLDLTGANFSHADLRGTDFSGAILRGTNFSHVKAGLVFPWLLLLTEVSLLIAVEVLAYLTSITLPSSPIFNDSLTRLAIGMGAITPIVGAVMVHAIEIWRIDNFRAEKKILVGANARGTIDTLLLIIGTGAVFWASILTIVMMKDFMHSKVDASGILFCFSFGIIAVLPGLFAGIYAFALFKNLIPRRNTILSISCVAVLAGILFGVVAGGWILFLCLLLMMSSLGMLCLPVQLITGLVEILRGQVISSIHEISVPEIILAPYLVMILTLLGVVSVILGRMRRWLSGISFFITFTIVSLAKEESFSPQLLPYCIALSAAFVFSLAIALATECTRFREADLTDANFTGARVKYADFTEAKFDNIS